MTPPHHAASTEPRVSADRGALMATIVHLWPYIWPSDRRDLKMRVVWATLLLLLAKFATIVTPFHVQVGDRRAGGRGQRARRRQ